ncbi:class I SAM-dependent methyltransferase [Nocardiopsis algeriensis]|uniref:SAM-dependent methyltransferase n=1 Tax=Nocardiopsis algeriensis TaxID=1478215 RepID=A0A841ITD4_9ACTN|nr:SAM-dependent methyltransferase [Nocardiopsis algeriensis]
MSGAGAFTPEWLAMREGADARARAARPVALLRGHGRTVADLGCGTGSLGRWLAPRLPGARHWILFDHDPVLLEAARTSVPADTVETRLLDLADLRPRDLEGATLVAASALLDMLTGDTVAAVADSVAAVGCPALFTLSVTGRVELSPSDPLDHVFGEAFNGHQRRGGLLGPDAVAAAADAFAGRGYRCLAFPSPWRLDATRAELTEAWLRGWVGAAAAQAPFLPAEAYLERRLADLAAGRLSAAVHHDDLLLLPPGFAPPR